MASRLREDKQLQHSAPTAPHRSTAAGGAMNLHLSMVIGVHFHPKRSSDDSRTANLKSPLPAIVWPGTWIGLFVIRVTRALPSFACRFAEQQNATVETDVSNRQCAVFTTICCSCSTTPQATRSKTAPKAAKSTTNKHVAAKLESGATPAAHQGGNVRPSTTHASGRNGAGGRAPCPLLLLVGKLRLRRNNAFLLH